jgi:hypothetical protein
METSASFEARSAPSSYPTTHDDPESCGHGREDVPEALTGAHVGRVLSREIGFDLQVPRSFLGSKATPAAPERRGVADLARS